VLKSTHTRLSKLGAADSLATEQHFGFPSYVKTRWWS